MKIEDADDAGSVRELPARFRHPRRHEEDYAQGIQRQNRILLKIMSHPDPIFEMIWPGLVFFEGPVFFINPDSVV